MSCALSGDTVLQQSGGCIARSQKGAHLFYHYRTDELHLVSPAGYYIYQLCDGLRPIEEIERLLSTVGQAAAHTADATVKNFLEKLVARGILEVLHD